MTVPISGYEDLSFDYQIVIGPPPSPTVIPPVPTLSQWAVGLLAMMVIAVSWLQIRRRR